MNMTIAHALLQRLWLWLALSIFAIPGIAMAGGTSGGGGSLVELKGGRAIALDLYLSNPKSDPAIQLGSPLPKTTFLSTCNFESMKLDHDSAKDIAFERLDRWHQAAPHLTTLIRETLLAQIHFFYAYRNFDASGDSYYVPPMGPRDEQALRARTKTVILFDPFMGPLVAANAWNRLTDFSRAALLVHEALVHLQLASPMGLTQQNIRELTAQIMLGNPASGINLETAAFLPPAILDAFTDAQTPVNSGPDFRLEIENRLYMRYAEGVLQRLEQLADQTPEGAAWYQKNVKSSIDSCQVYLQGTHWEYDLSSAFCGIFLQEMVPYNLKASLPEGSPLIPITEELDLRTGGADWPADSDVLKGGFKGTEFYDALAKAVMAPDLYQQFHNEHHFITDPWVIRGYLDGEISDSQLPDTIQTRPAVIRESALTLGDFISRYFARF